MSTVKDTNIVNTTKKARKARTSKKAAMATETNTTIVNTPETTKKVAQVFINGRFWQNVEVESFKRSELKTTFANIVTKGKVTFIKFDGEVCKVTMTGLPYASKVIQAAHLDIKQIAKKIMEEQSIMRCEFSSLTTIPGKIVVYVKDNSVLKELTSLFVTSLTIQQWRYERKWAFVQVKVITKKGTIPVEDDVFHNEE